MPLSPLCSLKASDPAARVFRVREKKNPALSMSGRITSYGCSPPCVLRRLTWANLGRHPLPGCRGLTLEGAGGWSAAAESILHTPGPAWAISASLAQPSLQAQSCLPGSSQSQRPSVHIPRKEKYFQDSKWPLVSPSNSPSLLLPSPEKVKPVSFLARGSVRRNTGHPRHQSSPRPARLCRPAEVHPARTAANLHPATSHLEKVTLP